MLLGIDTSAGVGVAALRTSSAPGAADPADHTDRTRPTDPADGADLRDGADLAERYEARTSVHAEVLVPLVREVLGALGATTADVSGVVVGTGPAPFTGLRVGLVTARTLADALGVPLLGVCSLDVLAVQVLAALGPGSGPVEFLVAADARRREVYWARYRSVGASSASGVGPGRLERVAGPGVGSPVTLRIGSAERGDLAVYGPGTRRYPDDLGSPGGPVGTPGASGVDTWGPAAVSAAAMLRAVRDGVVETTGTEPLYLRRPDVAEPVPSLL